MKYVLVFLLLAVCTSPFCQDGTKLYFTSRGKSRVSMDSIYYYQCAAFSSGNTLSFSASSLPAWLSFNAEAHTLIGKPSKAGQYPVSSK